MNMKMKSTAFALFVSFCFLSCQDQGDVPGYVEIISLEPAPNQVNVDKAKIVSIRLSRNVGVNESAKIRMGYVNDTSAVGNYPSYGLTSPLVEWLYNGPFIWKPGRTIEVTIPKDISDPEGRTMKEDFVYRFSIARDTVPFQLVASSPRPGDTISIPAYPFVGGSLTFSDYLFLRDSILTITRPAKIHVAVRVIVDGRDTPEKTVHFVMENLSAASTYEITIPRQIKDYEGETLPQDYRIVFHTKP